MDDGCLEREACLLQRTGHGIKIVKEISSVCVVSIESLLLVAMGREEES